MAFREKHREASRSLACLQLDISVKMVSAQEHLTVGPGPQLTSLRHAWRWAREEREAYARSTWAKRVVCDTP